MSLAPGVRLGPYEIETQIGRGGMGEVYRARDSRLDRAVAVKILRADVASDPDRLRRFEQEARAASALNHPNILTVHDVGREGDVSYLAMEWVAGITLRQAMERGRLPLRQSLDLARQMASGLAKAHAEGIVHRDLKPDNVMIAEESLAKIVDFGLAKLGGGVREGQTAIETSVTLPGVVMGTAGYMSPEQASGGTADHRSDQFALGAILYELLTGRKPFERTTAAQTLAATIESDPEPIQKLVTGVPEPAVRIVERCLAKNPARRYDSTRDLARDLEQVVAELTHVEAVGHHRHPGRRRGFWVSAAGLLALVAGVAWLLVRPAPDEPVPQAPLVAVREFRNLSADPAQSYFAAGMTEEIRGQLSKIGSLRLLSRSAVDSYRDSDTGRMVADLGVTSLVDGSVRLEGERVRIVVELVDAHSHQTLWSDQYERRLSDIFAVQGDVALQVARALHASLSPAERTRVQRQATQNMEAYDLFLKSRQYSTSEQEATRTSMELLRRALELDPQFAMAKSALAYRLVFLANTGNQEAFEEGMRLAREAAEDDPHLAQPHFVLGTAAIHQGRDAEARLAFMRALELDPNNTDAMANLSINEAQFGRLDDSLLWARRLFERAGRSGNTYYHVGFPLWALYDQETTRRFLLRGEQEFPRASRIQMVLAALELRDGQSAAALSRLRKAVAAAPKNFEILNALGEIAFLAEADDAADLASQLAAGWPDMLGMLTADSVRLRHAFYLQRRGDPRAASELDAVVERGRAAFAAGSQNPYTMVDVAAALLLRGERDASIDLLEKAVHGGYRQPAEFAMDPIFKPILDDTRVRALIEHMETDLTRRRQMAQEKGLMDLSTLLP